MARRNLTFRMPVLLTWVGIAVLGAVVAVLVLAALRLGADTPAADRPLPEVAPALPTPAAEPVPEPANTEPLPEVAPAGSALSVAADGVLWRSTAAVCAPNTATATAPPVIERSENGTDWVPVTPAAALDVREVLWLQGIDSAAAEAVVRSGPECTITVLRTFTAGNFWQPYPDALTAPTIVDTAAGTITAGAQTPPLPCEAPLRAVTGALAPTVLCTGQLSSWADGGWITLPLGNLAAASGLPDGSLTTAREATAECAGVLLERFGAAGEALGAQCVPGAGVRAIHAAGDRTWLWLESDVEIVTWIL